MATAVTARAMGVVRLRASWTAPDVPPYAPPPPEDEPPLDVPFPPPVLDPPPPDGAVQEMVQLSKEVMLLTANDALSWQSNNASSSLTHESTQVQVSMGWHTTVSIESQEMAAPDETWDDKSERAVCWASWKHDTHADRSLSATDPSKQLWAAVPSLTHGVVDDAFCKDRWTGRCSDCCWRRFVARCECDTISSRRIRPDRAGSDDDDDEVDDGPARSRREDNAKLKRFIVVIRALGPWETSEECVSFR
jgi:hypothetical protein